MSKKCSNIILQKSLLLLIFRPYSFAHFYSVLSKLLQCFKSYRTFKDFSSKICLCQFLCKKACQKKDLVHQSQLLGRRHEQKKSQGVAKKNSKIARWQVPFFCCKKACPEKFLSEVLAIWRTSRKRQATHTVKVSEHCNFYEGFHRNIYMCQFTWHALYLRILSELLPRSTAWAVICIYCWSLYLGISLELLLCYC